VEIVDEPEARACDRALILQGEQAFRAGEQRLVGGAV
jgi:hypothetical protein